MPEHVRTDETREVEARTGHSIAFVDIWGKRVIRAKGVHDFGEGARPFDTFARSRHGLAEDVDLLLGTNAYRVTETLGATMAAIAQAGSIPFSEQHELHPVLDGAGGVSISLVAPGAGPIDQIDADRGLAERVARIVRERGEDAEGREMPTICAMAMGVAAVDEAELDRIVDTVFAAGHARYRGVRSTLKGQDLIVLTHDTGEISIGQHGIDVKTLPETVRTAIHGHTLERRRLADLIDIPGFGHLLIRQTTRHAGPDGLRIVVTDERMADLPLLDRHRAREAALRVLRAKGENQNGS